MPASVLALVSKIENGGIASLECLAAVAKALGAEVVYFAEPETRPGSPEDATDRRDAIRTIGTTVAVLGTGSIPRPLVDLHVDFLEVGWLHPSEHADALAHDVACLNRWYQAAQYNAVQSALPRVLSAFSLGSGPASGRRLIEVQSNALLIAAKVANKTGNSPKALDLAMQARALSEEAGDAHGMAAADYHRATALMGTGEVELAEEVSLAGVGAIDDSTAVGVTWGGALTLVASMLAAKRRDLRSMSKRLDEAESLADSLGRDGNIGWTAFGPTNVKIHRISAAVELDAPKDAVEALSRIDINAIPSSLTGRRVQVHLDSAWAFFEQKDDAQAVLHLLEAERSGPEVVRNLPTASRVVCGLLSRERSAKTPGLRALAKRLRVDA